jgi:hypothetical protein
MKNDIGVHFPRFSGAILVEEYQSLLKEAGLSSISNVYVSIPRDADFSVTRCCLRRNL